jgi:hypothetical protein
MNTKQKKKSNPDSDIYLAKCSFSRKWQTIPHAMHEAYWHPNALLNSDATENKGKAEISNLS